MNKVFNFLSSLKLSFALLVLLFGVIIQRAILAQRYFLAPDPEQVPRLIRWFDSLGVDSLELLHFIFWSVVFLLAVNLSFAVPVMVKSGKARRKGLVRFKSVDSLKKISDMQVLNVPRFDLELARRFFRRKGFRVVVEDFSGTRLFAVRRDLGQWGVLVFHLTFFLLFLGGMGSFLTRFTGYLELAPGESFVEKFDNYLQKTPKPLLFEADNEFKLVLEEINLSYWKPGEVRQRAAVLKVIDSSGAVDTKKVSVNNPLSIANVKVYQGSRHGFVAGLQVTDQVGTTATGHVRFLLAEQKGPELITWVRLPGTVLDLKLELYSDMVRDIEGLEDFYSSRFTGSLMKVSSAEYGGDPVYHGVVFGGGNLTVEGLDVQFVSLKPFTSFIITRDYGVPVIYTGFVCLLVSLFMTYFWVPERYWITAVPEGTASSVYVGGNTDRYKESFRERFAVLVREFEEVLRQ